MKLLSKILIFTIGSTLYAQQINLVKDSLEIAESNSVHIEGYLGKKLDECIENGVMNKNFNLYVDAFKNRPDDPSRWAGEFWGKWFTSAVLAYRYKPFDEYKKILDSAIEGLIKTQDKDGRLSSYKKDFGDWDIWGRKYALLGLIAYYDETGSRQALNSASMALDNIITIAGPGKRKLTETGLSILESLSSSSILEPVVLIYQRTGNKKYLNFAEYLVSLWSEPNEYTKNGMKLVEDAISGKDPINISSPKGYEQMSCYEGLAELYRVTGNKKYLNAVVTFGHQVLKREIMIVGSGSSGELWIDGAMRQTEILEQPMETCVTATWMKFCYQLLRLTGDPIWADALEITTYNSMLSAMIGDGSWWAYFSPLTGERMPSPLQVPICNSSCCVANGPRGLLTVPGWSVMKNSSGPVINLYAAGEYKHRLKNNKEIKIKQTTNYPETDEIILEIDQEGPQEYTLSLRIPEWSKKTTITINGQAISPLNTGYQKIQREWHDGDKVVLTLDLRGRIIPSPASTNNLSIMRGPIVLALDNRLVEAEDYSLWLLHNDIKWQYNKDFNVDYVLFDPLHDIADKDLYIELKPKYDKPNDIWMAFEVPFLYRPTHFVKHEKKTLVLCDYSSAGNEYSTDNLFRVWMPQPMFLGNAFPENTWKVLYYKTKEGRPEIPMKDNSN